MVYFIVLYYVFSLFNGYDLLLVLSLFIFIITMYKCYSAFTWNNELKLWTQSLYITSFGGIIDTVLDDDLVPSLGYNSSQGIEGCCQTKQLSRNLEFKLASSTFDVSHGSFIQRTNLEKLNRAVNANFLNSKFMYNKQRVLNVAFHKIYGTHTHYIYTYTQNLGAIEGC